MRDAGSEKWQKQTGALIKTLQKGADRANQSRKKRESIRGNVTRRRENIQKKLQCLDKKETEIITVGHEEYMRSYLAKR